MGVDFQLNEILTADEVASWLKLSRSQVYKLVHSSDSPMPVLKIGASLRFNRNAVAAWLATMTKTA